METLKIFTASSRGVFLRCRGWCGCWVSSYLVHLAFGLRSQRSRRTPVSCFERGNDSNWVIHGVLDDGGFPEAHFRVSMALVLSSGLDSTRGDPVGPLEPESSDRRLAPHTEPRRPLLSEFDRTTSAATFAGLQVDVPPIVCQSCSFGCPKIPCRDDLNLRAAFLHGICNPSARDK